MNQGSAEWFAARAGKVTSSAIKHVLANGKGGADSKTREKYRAQIVTERLTGESQEDSYENDAMRHGTEMEPFARAAYEAEHECFVDQVAFIDHPTVGDAGCSPDGLVGEYGGVEIKCPNTTTHIRWFIAGEVPAEHVKQMQWCMAVTGRQWWDFVSYDNRLPDSDLFLFVKRLQRDDKAIQEMEKAVVAFNDECDKLLRILNKEDEAA